MDEKVRPHRGRIFFGEGDPRREQGVGPDSGERACNGMQRVKTLEETGRNWGGRERSRREVAAFASVGFPETTQDGARRSIHVALNSRYTRLAPQRLAAVGSSIDPNAVHE